MSEKHLVIVKPSFKLCFAHSKVNFWWLLFISYYFSRINYFERYTFIFKWVVVMVLTAAKISISLIFFGSNMFVVVIYNFCHIVHATTANLHVVFIKYFMILMIYFFQSFLLTIWKFFVEHSFLHFGERAIVPYDGSETFVAFSWCCPLFWTLFDVLINPTVLQNRVVKRSAFTENIVYVVMFENWRTIVSV